MLAKGFERRPSCRPSNCVTVAVVLLCVIASYGVRGQQGVLQFRRFLAANILKSIPANLLVRPHPVSPPSTDGGEVGNWTYRCTLTLSNASLAQAAVPGQPLDTNNSAAPPPAPPPNLVLRCEERSTSPAGALTAGLGTSLAAGPVAVEGVGLDASLRVATPGAGAADWGLTLSGSGNLLIADSALTDLPLSPVAPLLHVIGFAHVTLRNVSVSRLTGAPVLFTGGTPIGPEVQMHGPVALDVTSSASVVDCDCTNIVNAHGWSCFAARMQPQPHDTTVPPTLVFRMEGTVVDSASVVWAGPDMACPTAGYEGSGMGAVVLNNTFGSLDIAVVDSWIRNTLGGCGAGLAAVAADDSNSTMRISSTTYYFMTTRTVNFLEAGAIYVARGSWSTVLYDVLVGQTEGGAFFADQTQLAFAASRCTLWFNVVKQFGGVLFVSGEVTSLQLDGCSFNRNGAQYGGVVGVKGHVNGGAITNTVIQLSRADQGGVVFIVGNLHNMRIADGTVIDSSKASYDGGVLFVSDVVNLTIANNTNITNNYANGDGGVIMAYGGVLRLTVADNSHLDGNSAQGAMGGAIFAAQPAVGADTAIDGVLVTNGSSISFNSACKGGALAGNRGGISNVTLSLSSHMDHNTAASATCSAGSEILGQQEGRPGGVGGAMLVLGGLITDITLLGGSSISTNRALNAGGAMASMAGNITRIVVAEGSSMSSNTAELGKGGAVYIPPDALGGTISAVQLLSGSHMDFNAAEAGGVMAAGGIDDVSIDGASSMDRNRAQTMGGALCATSGSLTRVTVSSGSSMDENLALESGGALAAPAGNISQLLVTGDSSVSRNTAQGGSGGALFAAQGGISDCSVQAGSRMSGNLAALDGGAAYAGAGIDGFRVGDGSRLDSNMAGRSGGVLYAAGSVSLAVSGSSTLSDNTAEQHGGAIYTNASVTALEMSGSSNVSGNSARGNGGALYAAGSIEHLAVTGASSLLDNSASLQGGAVWAPIIVFMELGPGCSVTGNSAGQAGGAISTGCSATVSSDWQVHSSNVSANRAGTSGGALYINGRAANPAEPRVAGVISLDASGAAFVQNQAAVSGGAIAQEGPLCRLAVSGGAFTRNAAGATGGAMAALAGGSIEASGVTVGPGNTADTGAGLFAADAGTVSVHGSSISGNTATSSGGGMGAQGSGSALTASFSQVGPNNRAAMGGGLFAGPASSVVVRGSNVSSNAASNRGGSVAAALCGSLRLYDSLLTGSTARSDGGGVSAVGCQLVHISGTRLQSNVAGRGGALFLGASADTAGCGAGQDACMLVVSGNSSMSGNIAAPSTDTAHGVPQGYGGAVFAEHVPGLILLVDSSTAFNLNNAWLGADVASLQTCAAAQGGQEQQAAGTAGSAADTAALCAQEALAAAGASSIAWSVPTSCASAVAGAANCSRALLAQDLLLSSRYTPGAATAISPAVSTDSVAYQIPIAQARPAWFADMEFSALEVLLDTRTVLSPPKENLAGVEVPVAEARLDCAGGGGPCSWRSGGSMNAIVAMYDARGLPVSSVPSAGYTVTMSLVCSGASSQAPWLVIGGKPMGPWSFTVGATARMALNGTAITGWPGTYTLELQSLSLEAATPLRNTSTSLRLQGCALGEFLDLPSPQPSTEDLYLRTCSRCPVQSVGLYEDPRVALDMAAAGASSDAALQTRKLGLTRLASRMCLSCPDNAVCPRGLDMAPLPGYWHSSPRSPFMHACLYQAACSDASGPSVRAAAAALSNSAVVADLKLRLEDILGPLSNNRTLMLAALRQHVLTSEAAGAPRRSLSGSNSSNVTAIADYLQAQCAEGYTGNLCATCQPGYTLNSFFWCTECPSQSQTIVIGVFVLLCTVAMIVLTAVENLSETEPEEEKPDDGHARAKKVRSIVPRDVLKVLVVHIQYYIVISRLNIPKPDLMAPVSAVLTAIIGAESLWSYSHACLLSNQNSAGQAHLSMLGALLTPCACLAMSLLLWALRYGIFNAARFYRSRMGDHHVNPMFWGVVAVSLGEDGAEQGKPAPDTEAGSEEQAKDSQNNGKQSDMTQQGDLFNGGSDSSGSSQCSPPTSRDDIVPADQAADPALPASNSIPSTLSSKCSNSSLGVSPFEKPKNQSLLDSQSSVDRRAQLISPSSSLVNTVAGLVGLGDEEHATSAPATGIGAADAGAFLPSPFALMYKKTRPAKPSSSSSGSPAPLKGEPGVSPFADPTAGPPSPAAMLLDDASSLTSRSTRESGLDAVCSVSSLNPQSTLGVVPSRLTSVPTILEQRSSALGSTLSSRMSSIRRQVSTASQKLEGLRDRSAAVSGLALVDRTLSLAQQLWIVAVIAVFVLFPSWASAAFSVFSCYTLDDASSGAEMQGLEFGVASYARGYWSRNMNQECYTDSHMGLYVPLGIVFVIIFCAGPPAYNLVMLWRVRDKLGDYQTQQVYGFMYSRYKAKFFWWDTVLLLETLALVAVDVFGGDLNVSYQALMLQLVLLLIAGINIVVEPIRSSTLRRIEFSSTSILAATIAFNMYYVVGSVTLVDEGGGAAIAIITIVINLSFLIALAVIAVLASKVDLAHLMKRANACCTDGSSNSPGRSSKAFVELQVRMASSSSNGSVRSASSPRSGAGFRARFAASASGCQAPSRLKQSQLAVVSEVVVEE